MFNRKYIFNVSIFYCHVSLPGCNWDDPPSSKKPPLVPRRLTSPVTSPPFATKAAASAGARPKPIPRAMPRAPGLPGLKRQGGRPFPKDPFVCSFRKGFPLSSFSGDGIQTINPTLGRRLESLPGILVLMAEILLIS